MVYIGYGRYDVPDDDDDDDDNSVDAMGLFIWFNGHRSVINEWLLYIV